MRLHLYAVPLIALAALGLAVTPHALAFGLKPTGTDDERAIVDLESGFPGLFWSGIARQLMEHFSTNVHEELTHRIWGCEPPALGDVRDETCANSAAAPAPVLYGVQWNDNPPFKLDVTREGKCVVNAPIRLPDLQPKCWQVLFGDAKKKAAQGEYFRQSNGMALLYRAHFGDLQFLHSMASWNGETMRDTKARIMMWAEFTYKVSTGEIAPSTRLHEIRIPGFRNALGGYWGDVSTLFTYGVTRYSRNIPDVAFGSLLHMLQDSFSKSHVSREHPSGTCEVQNQPNAGRIIEFHGYGSQDADKHGQQDSRNFMLAGLRERPDGNIVVVGRYVKGLSDARAPWDIVRGYLDSCVYAVAEEDAENPAGPGERFRP